jgi:hypothetical protein
MSFYLAGFPKQIEHYHYNGKDSENQDNWKVNEQPDQVYLLLKFAQHVLKP